MFPLAASVCPTVSPSPLLYCSYPPAASHPSLCASQPPLCSPLPAPFNCASQPPLSLTPSLLVIPTSATGHHHPLSNILISISAPPPPHTLASHFISVFHTLLPSPSPALLLGCCQHHRGVVIFFFSSTSAHQAANSSRFRPPYHTLVILRLL